MPDRGGPIDARREPEDEVTVAHRSEPKEASPRQRRAVGERDRVAERGEHRLPDDAERGRPAVAVHAYRVPDALADRVERVATQGDLVQSLGARPSTISGAIGVPLIPTNAFALTGCPCTSTLPRQNAAIEPIDRVACELGVGLGAGLAARLGSVPA